MCSLCDMFATRGWASDGMNAAFAETLEQIKKAQASGAAFTFTHGFTPYEKPDVEVLDPGYLYGRYVAANNTFDPCPRCKRPIRVGDDIELTDDRADLQWIHSGPCPPPRTEQPQTDLAVIT